MSKAETAAAHLVTCTTALVAADAAAAAALDDPSCIDFGALQEIAEEAYYDYCAAMLDVGPEWLDKSQEEGDRYERSLQEDEEN